MLTVQDLLDMLHMLEDDEEIIITQTKVKKVKKDGQ